MTPARPRRVRPSWLLVLAVAVVAALLVAGSVTPQPWRAGFFGAAGAITGLTAYHWHRYTKAGRVDPH